MTPNSWNKKMKTCSLCPKIQKKKRSIYPKCHKLRGAYLLHHVTFSDASHSAITEFKVFSLCVKHFSLPQALNWQNLEGDTKSQQLNLYVFYFCVSERRNRPCVCMVWGLEKDTGNRASLSFEVGKGRES